MDPVLIAGIVIIALLVGVSVLQRVFAGRQAAVERALPNVPALAALALSKTEYPAGYSIQYRGPVTNDRLAYDSDDEDATFSEVDSAGRLIGYRQAFRDPRSFGEIPDVLLNLTLRRSAQQKQIDVEIVLFEDEEGAREGIDEDLPPNPNLDDDGNSLEVSNVDGHGLDFAASVRQWSRKTSEGRELQRKVEVRWQEGRLGCFVTVDSEPPGAIEPDTAFQLARRVHDRAAASDLRAEALPA